MPITSRLSPESSSVRESSKTETDSKSTISGNHELQSSTTTGSTTSKQPKPMSQISSSLRKDLSRADSLAADVIYLPKYGVKTDRETELGEVFFIFAQPEFKTIWMFLYNNILMQNNL